MRCAKAKTARASVLSASIRRTAVVWVSSPCRQRGCLSLTLPAANPFRSEQWKRRNATPPPPLPELEASPGSTLAQVKNELAKPALRRSFSGESCDARSSSP